MNRNDLMKGLITYLNEEKLIYDIDDCLVSILTGTYNIRIQFEYWGENDTYKTIDDFAGLQIWLFTNEDNDSFDPDYIDDDISIEILTSKIDEFRELSKTFNLSIGLIRNKFVELFEIAKTNNIPSNQIDNIYSELYSEYEDE